MKNQEVAQFLYEMADLLDILNVAWKPVAYRKAARIIETLSDPIEDVYARGGMKALMDLPGVGENIAKKIEEYLKTGKVKELRELEKQIPKGIDEMMHLQGLGPKKAWRLYHELNIKGLKDLEKAAKEHRISKLEGFGEKSEADILQALGMHTVGQTRRLLLMGLETARELEKRLSRFGNAVAAGSVRRRKETVGDIDILVTTSKVKQVMDYFTTMPDVRQVLAKGDTRSAVILSNGMQADARVLDEKVFGAALQYFTGSKEHNVKIRQMAIKKGYKLSEYGLFSRKTDKLIAAKTEEEIYKKLGLPYIEPEMREDAGEIEAALKGRLPKLIGYKDLRGDCHMHTVWSDGAHTTEEMVAAAVKLGHEYIAITDHSKSTVIANGLDEKRVLKHIAEIEKLRKKFPDITILTGSECDILKDGSLDYKPAILKQLDVIIASVHSSMKMNRADMTKRYLKAIDTGFITAIGHPTGRLINVRQPFDFDFEKVAEAAAKKGVAFEINSNPQRLDLKDSHIRTAKRIGCQFMIDTDSHSTDHMRFIELGIAQARRGWVEAKDVLNALPRQKFLKAIQR